MIAKLPLVPFVIINLTRLTAGVCMKVRFKSKVGSLAAQEKPLGPGQLLIKRLSGLIATFQIKNNQEPIS